MRNVNAEINSVALVRCPECGLKMQNHQVMIQRHFLKYHNITEQVKKREKEWKFGMSRLVHNPLDLKNIFG